MFGILLVLVILCSLFSFGNTNKETGEKINTGKGNQRSFFDGGDEFTDEDLFFLEMIEDDND